MKNLYPKGKGKIHPSPSPPGTSAGDAAAVLALMPAAILALTAALGAEDREVLAYLVTRSLQGPCSVVPEERRRCRRQGHNRPLFDCGCFDCYTSYWFRWDSSPDRELIHQAIEAFEEHLASSEQQRSGGKSGRRRDRRLGDRSDKAADGKSGNGKRKTGKKGEEKASSNGPTEAVAGEGTSEGGSSPFRGERDDPALETETEASLGGDGGDHSELVDGAGTGMQMEALPQQPGAERRKPWADVMGLFSSRFWNLWSPASLE